MVLSQLPLARKLVPGIKITEDTQLSWKNVFIKIPEFLFHTRIALSDPPLAIISVPGRDERDKIIGLFPFHCLNISPLL